MISDTVPRLPQVLGIVTALAAAGLTPAADGSTDQRVDVLRPVSAVPAHVVARFDVRALFAQTSDGTIVVLDRRNHGLFTSDPVGRAVRRIVETGWEAGHLLDAEALAVGGHDIIGVLDTPQGFDRIQYFSITGMRIGGFYLPLRATPRLSLEGTVVDAPSWLGFDGTTFLVNQPDWGGLFTQLDANGGVMGQIGVPRVTVQAGDAEVERAMNIGIPLFDPTGGFYFVFPTGIPVFRRYDESGRLVFERHIEGVELDARLLASPTTWVGRAPGTKPVVSPLVRAAAVDPQGRLWVSLTVPYTYVYDQRGEKIRTVQFLTTGVASPSSLFFTPEGRVLISPGGYVFMP